MPNTYKPSQMANVIRRLAIGTAPINILHPKSYTGSAYNSPDPNVSISRASDDAATVTFNGTKANNDTINYQLQIPDEVIKTFVGCKIRVVSDDSRVKMHVQKQTSPWTSYGAASHGEFLTIPSISESDIVFCIDIKEAGEYNNVTGYLEVFGGVAYPTLKIIDSAAFQHYNSIASRYDSSPLNPCLPAIAFKAFENNSLIFPRLANSQFDGVSTPSFYKPSGAVTGIIFLQKVDKAYNKLYIKAKSTVKKSEYQSRILLTIGGSGMAFNTDGWPTGYEKYVRLADSGHTAEQIMSQDNLTIVSSDPALLSEQTIVYSIPNAANDYFIGLAVWNQEIYISDMYLTVE